MVSNDGTKVVLNSLETLAAIQFLADAYTTPDYQYAIPPGSDGWKDTSNDEAWLAGTVGITRRGIPGGPEGCEEPGVGDGEDAAPRWRSRIAIIEGRRSRSSS